MLVRRMNEHHTTIRTHLFPRKRNSTLSLRYTVIIGVGGNVGNVKRRFHHLWFYLKQLKRLEVVQSGVILKNPPFGYLEQDDFYNTVFMIKTSLSPRGLLRFLWRVENRFGRRRSFPNGPRTLDLDILFFENRRIHTSELIIPHPGWNDRLSVKIPLRSLNRTCRRHYENLDI